MGVSGLRSTTVQQKMCSQVHRRFADGVGHGAADSSHAPAEPTFQSAAAAALSKTQASRRAPQKARVSRIALELWLPWVIPGLDTSHGWRRYPRNPFAP